MSTAPVSLQGLAAAWVKRGGVNLGIVGNKAHTYGYHLGQDRLYGPYGQGDRDYSVRQARDRKGLTNEACALDLGKLEGSLPKLQDFSRWLVKECLAGRMPTIREVIYSPDGKVVRRWESLTNTVLSGPGQGDDSHLWHTHISFWRDTVRQVPATMFARYWTREYSAHFDANAKVQVATVSPIGCIARWTTTTWGPRDSSAPCLAPVTKRGCLGGSYQVTKVTAGVFAGKWVRVAGGVTVSEKV